MSDFFKGLSRGRHWREGRVGLMGVLLLVVGTAAGQTSTGHITPNFKDADFVELVEAVSKATGTVFIIHPRVRARVTMLSSTEMSPADFYAAFLSLLPECGFIAVPEADRGIVTILPGRRAPPKLIRVAGLQDFSGFSCNAR